jgi:1,4-dihydroxy-2-naphthoyl-CoA synthase
MSRRFELGSDAFSQAYASEELREGMQAFREKCRANWATE